MYHKHIDIVNRVMLLAFKVTALTWYIEIPVHTKTLEHTFIFIFITVRFYDLIAVC